MRCFLDANILVSVLLKEYPLFTYTARILSLSSMKYKMYTSTTSLAIAFYFAEKKFGTTEAKKRLGIFLEHIHVSPCGEEEAQSSIKNKKVLDFEDGLQYYSALSEKCDVIITNDVKDYHFSSIEVMKPQDFWLKYVVNSTRM
jgi:predicted nucleic acid-binding protein